MLASKLVPTEFVRRVYSFRINPTREHPHGSDV